MVSVVDSSIADKAAASLEEIFLRLELPMRDRNDTKEGSPDPVQEDADKSVNDLRALVTPDTAAEIGIALGALKVRGREIYSVAIRRGSTSRADQIVIDAPVYSNERLLCSCQMTSTSLGNDMPGENQRS